MRIYLRLFRLELKKNLRMLPFVFLSAVAAALFLSLFIRLLSNSLYEEGSLARATVALVTNDAEDENMQLALRYITNMSSTSLALDYEVMEEDKALRALQKHDVIKLIAVCAKQYPVGHGRCKSAVKAKQVIHQVFHERGLSIPCLCHQKLCFKFQFRVFFIQGADLVADPKIDFAKPRQPCNHTV